MTQDDWLTVAMADTTAVAQILLNLRAAPPPPKRRRPEPPHCWTVRQRRSSTKSEPPRASPTTPLSWTAATSGSCCAAIADTSRSKATPPCETSTKRSRKKKTLVALKTEEVVLVEEQHHLKMKLAALQAKYAKQIKENVTLKKIKLDMQVETQGERPKATTNSHFKMVDGQNGRIVLPDLNVPFGEDAIVSY
ncbi:uncharacterized protein LOC143605977 [Bidens hawaiensis]|uniref:uncharacterized protein LOC143605977 n=1 Tax=Bidens hawaiensis TaxID=980011 RepID=UPI0040491C1B